ncbi:MAG: nitroreductase [Vicinamibacterales bacterium]
MMNATTPLELRALVEAAVLAPSSHNTQPWRFRTGNATVDLYADRRRALPVNDPDDRELHISCGAALFNLRVAAAHWQVPVAVSMLPDAADPDWLARVTCGMGSPEPLADLWPALTERRTHRRRFTDRAVEADEVEALAAAAAAEGATCLTVGGEATRHEVGALVAEADRRLWDDPRWRRELALWMHPRRRGDGLTLPGLPVPLAQFVVRTFDMGEGTGATDRALTEGSPLLALLETTGDSPRDWLFAGQALEHLLLTGCRRGLQASYLNQSIQVTALRSELGAVVGGSGVPQILLRLGYPAAALPATPRRPIDDVLDHGDGATSPGRRSS